MRKFFDLFSKYPEVVEFLQRKKIHRLDDLNINDLKKTLYYFNIKDTDLVISFMNKKNDISLSGFNDVGYDNNKLSNIVIFSDGKVENTNFLNNQNKNNEIISDDLMDKIYFVSKTRSLKLIEVLNTICYYISNKAKSKEEIYRHLCSYYTVNSFNRKNLAIVFNTYFVVNRNFVIDLKNSIRPFLLNYKSSLSSTKDTSRSFKLIYTKLKVIEKLVGQENLENFMLFGIKKSKYTLSCIFKKLNKEYYKDDDIFTESVISTFLKSLDLEERLQEMYFIKKMVINRQIINSLNQIEDFKSLVLRNNSGIFIERVLPYKLTISGNSFLFSESSDINLKLLIDNHDLYFRLIDLLKILSSNIENRIKNDLEVLLMSSNKEYQRKVFNILLGRSESPQVILEELGKTYQVTRERIRQIEKKHIDKFNKQILNQESSDFINMIKLISRNSIYITKQEMINKLQEHGKILYYLFKKGDFLTSEDNIETIFLSDSSWYEDLCQRIQSLPSQITEDELEVWIKETLQYYLDLKIELNVEMIHMIINELYRKKGSYYTLDRFTEVSKFETIINKYFPRGIHIYGDKDLKTFREKYSYEFKDTNIYDKSDRALAAIFSRFTYLLDKGFVNTKDKVIINRADIFADIAKYVDDSKYNMIFITGLFNIFKDNLVSIGINNRYHFQSNFRYFYDKKYFFKKDYIYKNRESYGIANEIFMYVASKDKAVTIKEIVRHFKHLSSNVTYNHINNHDQIVQFGFDQYTTLDGLKMEKNDVSIIRNIIDYELNDNDFASTDKIIFELQIHFPDLLEKYNIQDKHNLFAYLEKNLNDSYLYKRPFIYKSGVEPKNKEDILKGFVEMYREISITQIKDYAEQSFIKILDIFGFIKSLIPAYLWIDVDTIMKNDLELDNATIIEVRRIIANMLKHNNKIDLSKLNYNYFPNLTIEWTPYLFYSLLQIYYKDCYLIETTTNQYNSVEFILRRGD